MQRQKDWIAACNKSNHELKVACDEAVRLKGVNEKIEHEVQLLGAIVEEKNTELISLQERVKELENQVKKKDIQVKKLQTECDESAVRVVDL
ncbi:hypothetical protein Hanom_Chr07g00644861 [Helianthus anomalus]